MLARKWIVGTGLALLMGFAALATPGAANDANKTMYLTFNRPVMLPGVELAAGTYIFELADPFDAWSVVHVLSRDRKHVYFGGHTLLVSRPLGMPSNQFVSFAEAPRGAPAPITAWWPKYEQTGRQFMYPRSK